MPRGRQNAQIALVLNPWWRYILGMDNSAVLKKINCPVLAMCGDPDRQVSPDKNISLLRSSLTEGGNGDFLVERVPGLNHLFRTAETGSEYEYIRIEETIATQALQLMTQWIKSHSGKDPMAHR
jgi:dienelactone hydrolase